MFTERGKNGNVLAEEHKKVALLVEGDGGGEAVLVGRQAGSIDLHASSAPLSVVTRTTAPTVSHVASLQQPRSFWE